MVCLMILLTVSAIVLHYTTFEIDFDLPVSSLSYLFELSPYELSNQ